MTTWAQTPDVYTIPEVRLTSAAAPWLADAAVVSWQVERELVGSTLPGNIRARSGLSIGDASVVVAVESGTLAPWAGDLSRRVTVGSAATLAAVADDGDEFPLGAWLIDTTSGGLTSRETQVDLLEASSAGKKPKAALPVRGLDAEPVDPVWMIARLAEQVGYLAAPLPILGSFIDLPLDGGFDGRGTYPSATPDGLGTWEVLPGDVLVGTSGDGTLTLTPDPEAAYTWKSGMPVFLTLNLVGRVTVLDVAQGWKITLDADAHTVTIYNALDSATPETVSYVPGASADWSNRIQAQIWRDYDFGTEQWTAIRAEVRSGPDEADWSLTAEDATPVAEENEGTATTYFLLGQDFDGTTVTPAAPGRIAAVNMSGGGLPMDLWTAPNMLLKPLGGEVQVPYTPPGDDAWAAIQNVAAANLAAVHLDRDGVLTVLNRGDLAGAGTSGEVTDIGAEWTDLPWTLDPADSADRLEVSAVVPGIQEATEVASTTPAPELWRAEEIIEVPAGGELITLDVDVDGKAAEGLMSSFVTPAGLIEEPTYASRFSVVCHATGRDGSGALSVVDKFSISAIPLSPSRLRLQFRNTGTVPLYLVDANGEPCVIVRAWRVATFETPHVVALGAAAVDAVQPLTVDLGAYVQRPEDIADVAAYVWARVGGAAMWKASSVRCRLDWSHDIGKVLRLAHSRTGLEAKALVTKVAYDGSAGEIAQTLDLVMLPWTWADFDAAWAGKTWDDFDATWSGSTWDDFDADPLKTEA